jgi:ABC-2 type transport system ATP-binding protein
MTQARVEVAGLVKHFGDVVAVDDVTLGVTQGEVLGFLGPNGAGKTTTMRMITGYLIPDEGFVSICGISMLDDPITARAHIGYLPEGAPLYPDMSAAQFLTFCGEARGMRRDILEARLIYVRRELELASVWHRPMEELSKGFKRRVGLAQAILHNPEVLILDEPTDGLDPVQKHEVRQLITSMSTDKAIIISTHILEEVDAVCTRASILVKGKIAAYGTPDKLLKESGLHRLDDLFLKLASDNAPQEAHS